MAGGCDGVAETGGGVDGQCAVDGGRCQEQRGLSQHAQSRDRQGSGPRGGSPGVGLEWCRERGLPGLVRMAVDDGRCQDH